MFLEYKQTTTLMFVMDMMLHSTMDSQDISRFRDFRLLAIKLMSYFAAWIKMGDYYWYGLQGERNTTAAAEMYANAALGGDPHVGYLHGSSMFKTCYAIFLLLLFFTFTFLVPPDFGQSCHVCSWLTHCRWLFVAVV